MKVILIDWGHFIHSNGFMWMNKVKRELGLVKDEDIDYYKIKGDFIPSTYYAISSIISCLKKIGIDTNDIIILAIDYLSSWRKEIEKIYKKGRRKLLPELYKEFDWLLDKIDKGTNFYIIKEAHCEADDIMAISCRFFKDKEIILITTDSDLEQCWIYDNVKIFSPHPKSKKYKIKPKNFNPYKLISQKIYKEKADNLVSPILSEEDFDTRNLLVNLLELPDWVENKIKEQLSNLPQKNFNIEELPFRSIRERFTDIYKKNKIITYESCLKPKKKRKRRK